MDFSLRGREKVSGVITSAFSHSQADLLGGFIWRAAVLGRSSVLGPFAFRNGRIMEVLRGFVMATHNAPKDGGTPRSSLVGA